LLPASGLHLSEHASDYAGANRPVAFADSEPGTSVQRHWLLELNNQLESATGNRHLGASQ
jgi:hypothetical protein